jgi:hypothetical protein
MKPTVIMKKIILFLVFLATLGVSAQTLVTPYRPGVTEQGITYFLPKMGFHITVRMTKKTYFPGEYCMYAQRFLRLNNVTTTQYDVWTLEDIDLVPFGVADSSRVYTIQLNPKTSAPLVSLATDGRLLSVNTKVAEPSSYLPPKAEKIENVIINPDHYKTQEILSASSIMKMAELTAAEILDIRENRGLLAKGQADFMPTDGEQLKLMLSSLDTQEKALMQCFIGYNTSEQHVITFDYIPEKDIQNHVLFRFSKHKGVVDADDLAGAPCVIDIENLKTLPAEQPAPVVDKKGKKVEVLDLRYLLPEKVKVSLSYEGKVLRNITTPFPQLGYVEHLGGELFNKKFTTRVIISPLTGGVLSIEGEPVEKK